MSKYLRKDIGSKNVSNETTGWLSGRSNGKGSLSCLEYLASKQKSQSLMKQGNSIQKSC